MDGGSLRNSSSNEMSCKSVIEQGPNKGKQCWRPPTENGYCGKHQSDFLLEKGKSEGLHKCSRYRCTNMILEGKYCDECQSKKESEKDETTQCKGEIAQGKNKGKRCEKKASSPEGYCGKHLLNIQVEKAKEEGKRICDDGKRACKNYTEDGKLKCEDCLEKLRHKEREEYEVKKETGLCLDCGCELESLTRGFRKEVQRCEACYEKLREVERNRPDRNRNYREEMKANIDVHYGKYLRGANKRNIQFELTIEEFGNIVSLACYYCATFKENESIGIDRVDSNAGYIVGNVVPCCEECNIMKQDLSLEKFKEHITKIYNNLKDSPVVQIQCEKKSSYVRPRKILDMYNEGTLEKYIEICINDERSPAFIEKIRALKTIKLTETEARNYIRSALCSEQHSLKLCESRKRISKKELFEYLRMKNVDMCIQRYAEAHGRPNGFETDIRNLVRFWSDDNAKNFIEFNSILVKYQNKRAAH
jgi:hypothetical protein